MRGLGDHAVTESKKTIFDTFGAYLNTQYILKGIPYESVRQILEPLNDFWLMLGISGLINSALQTVDRGLEWVKETPEGVGNPVKIEGRGSTGRTTPNNLNEQMSMHEVKSNPLDGASNTGLTMGDTRWPSSEGWQKMQRVIYMSDGSKVTIHFNYTPIGELFDDFKFVFPN